MVNILRYTRLTLSFLYRHTIRPTPNFYKTYANTDSWAVVTGGSDGIGLQYCKDLAKQGFNICIIARNEQKMKEKLEEIKRECGK
jgi:FlaA1/EpsC-like NDP-sugar epimerase